MFANAMEVFKLLEKSNCKKCNESTCLAFASKVFLGQRSLGQCPVLDPMVVKRYSNGQAKLEPGEADIDKAMMALKMQLKFHDLSLAAQRTGGKFANGHLTLRIFGKPFALDNFGRFKTDIHINPWIAMPVLNYVLHCKGVPLTGKWVPFRELENAREMNGLFVQRSEKPLKKIADTYPNLFKDLILIFSGKKVDNHYESDISLVLYPLPRLPMLICYWKQEDGMASDLHLFFDSSAPQNAGIEVVFGLCSGIVQMFEKFVITHGMKEE